MLLLKNYFLFLFFISFFILYDTEKLIIFLFFFVFYTLYIYFFDILKKEINLLLYDINKKIFLIFYSFKFFFIFLFFYCIKIKKFMYDITQKFFVLKKKNYNLILINSFLKLKSLLISSLIFFKNKGLFLKNIKIFFNKFFKNFYKKKNNFYLYLLLN